MALTAATQHGGGFLPPDIPSPPSSVVESSIAPCALPRPRQHPLKSGSSKETAFINHADQAIADINRRYAKRHTVAEYDEASATRGYSSYREAGRDIERLIDLVWVSGTPTLQISYMLSLALLTLMFLDSFSPDPRSLFRLLSKLDTAFASLIQGKDLDTGESLPGFLSSRGVSATEKVRIKSLVERTRVAVVQVMNKGEFEVPESGEEAEDRADVGRDRHLDDRGHFDMDVARVYDRTVVELGDTLAGPSIGIPES